MDDELARRFFLQPTQTLGRHYEILRGYFVEQRTLGDLADSCGLNYYTVRSLVRRFREQCRRGEVPPFLSNPMSAALPGKQDGTHILNQRRLPIAGSCG